LAFADLAGALVVLELLALLDQHFHLRLAGVLDDHRVLRGEGVERILQNRDQEHGDDHQKDIDDVDHREDGVVAIVVVQDAGEQAVSHGRPPRRARGVRALRR
jgi:hypothetical protein